MLNDQSGMIKQQSSQISELLGYAKDTKESLHIANENILDLHDEVSGAHMRVIDTHLKVVQNTKVIEEIDELLREKSITSTMNPKDESLVHHALVMVKHLQNGNKIVLRSGQSYYIDQCKNKLVSEGYKTLLDKFYQANGIDYRRNVQSMVLDFIEDSMEPFDAPILAARESLKIEIDTFNETLHEVVDTHNENLVNTVAEHNQTATDKTHIYLSSSGTFYRWKGIKIFGKIRSYEKEYRDYGKEIRGRKYQFPSVPITVNSKSIYWKPNNYISYEDLCETLFKVKEQTQHNPRE